MSSGEEKVIKKKYHWFFINITVYKILNKCFLDKNVHSLQNVLKTCKSECKTTEQVLVKNIRI